MSSLTPSVFRTALQTSGRRISHLTDDELSSLMWDLLRAQAYVCRSPISEVRVNTESSARDGGCDGWSAKPDSDDDWFGDSDTCWQFKAGTAGRPANLRKEVTKPIPRETLEAGGRFVVVASRSTSGRRGEDARRRILVSEAAAAGLPTDKISVIGSERLTTWCNSLPAVAARWAGRPDGLWTVDDWARAEVHRVAWQGSEEIESQLTKLRSNLDLDGGGVHHLHIQGKPGVGKTRFALELCREAAWRELVVYIPQAEDLRLAELVDSAATEPGVRIVVVVDEVQPEQLEALRNSVGRSDGRVRLVTIGHCRTPDTVRIPAQLIQPLEDRLAREVARGFYPAMPIEQVDFVVRFADGYVKLLRLAAGAVHLRAATDVRGLLGRDDISSFLDKMLGSHSRRPLHLVAALSSVGWAEDKEEEGRAVAAHLGLIWNEVRAEIKAIHQRFGIVPRGGRYRYVSPTPLGVYLAVDAWETCPELMRSLPGALPSEATRDAYYERLRSIVSNPQAQEFAREELASFYRLDDFVPPTAARRWGALAGADPDRAASNILCALSGASVEDRLRIQDQARREAVQTLGRLAWPARTFTKAARALALLAEAENETWANNATGEFLARFQIIRGGTAAPYLERLTLLDELADKARPTVLGLVIKALAKAGEQKPSRVESGFLPNALPEIEWRPETATELRECTEAAVRRLTSLAGSGAPENEDDFVAAAEEVAPLLLGPGARTLVVDLFDAVGASYPDARETLRKIIVRVLYRARDHPQGPRSESVRELDELRTRLEDSSLGGRLRQYVGNAPWETDEQPDLTPLARELVASPAILQEEWPWLTSGEAPDGWRLGEALATVDPTLASALAAIPGQGSDLRVLCSYVLSCRKVLGDDWYDEWVSSQLRCEPTPVNLVFDVVMRAGVTRSIAHRLADLLRAEPISHETVGKLAFGDWHKEIPQELLAEVLEAMASAGHADTAVAVLWDRMRERGDERDAWKPLALKLVTAPEAIRSGGMTSYQWGEAATATAEDHAGEIAAAIIREHADRSEDNWFVEHSGAAPVLRTCVELDPRAAWRAIQPHLATKIGALRFGIGFPRDVLGLIPAGDILAWVAENPQERAAIIARPAGSRLDSDETLAAQVLGAYGDKAEVSTAFLHEYISGSYWGNSSSHWEELAETAEAVAARTEHPKLRQWAEQTARALHRMAEQDRKLEDEEDLGRG